MLKSTYETEDTIVAIASASGNGLRGTVRLSGPEALAITDQVFHARACSLRTEAETDMCYKRQGQVLQQSPPAQEQALPNTTLLLHPSC